MKKDIQKYIEKYALYRIHILIFIYNIYIEIFYTLYHRNKIVSFFFVFIQFHTFQCCCIHAYLKFD